MVSAVLFDLDGLMFDTEPTWSKAWVPTLAEYGFEMKEGFDDACRGMTKDSLAHQIECFYGSDINGFDVIETLDKHARILFEQGCPKKPGLDELLQFLADQNIPCAVASSSSLEIVTNHLKHGNILDQFKSIVTRERIQKAKPAPDIFLEAAKDLDADPTTTYVLEDSIAGVKAGLAGGFRTIMVPDMVMPTAEILESKARVCSDLYEATNLIAKDL